MKASSSNYSSFLVAGFSPNRAENNKCLITPPPNTTYVLPFLGEAFPSQCTGASQWKPPRFVLSSFFARRGFVAAEGSKVNEEVWVGKGWKCHEISMFVLI